MRKTSNQKQVQTDSGGKVNGIEEQASGDGREIPPAKRERHTNIDQKGNQCRLERRAEIGENSIM